MFYVSLLVILVLNLILPTITYAAPLQKLIVAGDYGDRNLDRNPMLAVIDSKNITLTNFPQIVGSPGKINCNNNGDEQMFCAIKVVQKLLVTSDSGRAIGMQRISIQIISLVRAVRKMLFAPR